MKLKGRWLWIVISANLLVLVGLAFAYPYLMVAPGALEQGHAGLTTDCFACHALPDIGRRTTTGVAIKAVSVAVASRLKASFHQDLTEQNCMACHSEHAGPKLTQHSRNPFSHALLRPQPRDRCESCQQAPADTLHKQLTGNTARSARSSLPGSPPPSTTPRSSRSTGTTRDLRDLPHRQRLPKIHLLRLPRAHPHQHAGQAPRRRHHRGPAELRALPPKCQRRA